MDEMEDFIEMIRRATQRAAELRRAMEEDSTMVMEGVPRERLVQIRSQMIREGSMN